MRYFFKVILCLFLVGCAATKVRQPTLIKTQPANWCGYFAPGPVDNPSKATELLLSRAHSTRRFFGVGNRYSAADQALARALQSQPVDRELDLKSYAQELPETCWLPADSRPVTNKSQAILARSF